MNNSGSIQLKIVSVFALTCFVIMLLMGFRLYGYLAKESEKPEISKTLIQEKVNTISELCVTDISLSGVIKFEDGSIPFINLKKFSMVYSANIKLGFDLSKSDIRVSGNEIKIKLPEPQIISNEIDESSIEFYDEKNSLLNRNKKEDITLAIQKAKEDSAEKALGDLYAQRAKQDAGKIIETMLSPVDNSSSYSIEFTDN